ncbi:DUF3102 domain-containing protein [Desulfosporosinus lacus]|nr:DUF3102 domain-containing protein [Desulfosporosinus lacus]
MDFSQSRANKLMRIFKEYGARQLTSLKFESGFEFELQPGS